MQEQDLIQPLKLPREIYPVEINLHVKKKKKKKKNLPGQNNFLIQARRLLV
jgi:hypothetical protein